VPLSERSPRAGIQSSRGQVPYPSCQNPSATGIRHRCQPLTGQELRLTSPGERTWTGSHRSQEQPGGTDPTAAALRRARRTPRWAARLKPGTMCGSPGTAVARRHCRCPLPPGLPRQGAGMPVCNSKGLKMPKNPRTALLFCRFVNDTLASSQHNKIQRRIQRSR